MSTADIRTIEQTPVCDAIASSGNDCRQPAHYSFATPDGHVTYACEMHRDSVLATVVDVEDTFTYRVLDTRP